MARAVWFVVGAITIASGTAHALKPGTHADVAKASCKAAGLSDNFCTRIATEDYDTDEREWDDLSAHAQIDDGETACVAADKAAERLRKLGSELPAALVTARSGSNDDVGAVGSIVGRALHTIQDNCAHHGMPNPQHAWLSLGDFCEGTSTSPDVQDDAIACARTESDAIMRVVAQAVAQANVASILNAHSCPPAPNNGGNHGNTNQQSVCQGRYLPSPFEACDFLGRAKDWDGTDRRWNNSVATAALRNAFAAGVAGTSVEPICNGDESRLSAAVSNPIADVSAGTPSCPKAAIFCLGKADDSENPFADDPTAADTGCNTTGGRSGIWMIALALVMLRRSATRQWPRMKA